MEWVIPTVASILLSAVVSSIGVMWNKASKSDSEGVAKAAVQPVERRVSKIEHDLARQYVRHEDLMEMRRDIKRLLRTVTAIQIALAKHFKIDLDARNFEGDEG